MTLDKWVLSRKESDQSWFVKRRKLEKVTLYVKVSFAQQFWSRLEVKTQTAIFSFFHRIIRRVWLTTWQRDETNKRFNLCPILDTLTCLGEHEKSSRLALPLPLHSSGSLSAPRIASPNWSWQRVFLKLSPRLTDGIHFSSGLSIKMDSNSPHNFQGGRQKWTPFVSAQQLIE